MESIDCGGELPFLEYACERPQRQRGRISSHSRNEMRVSYVTAVKFPIAIIFKQPSANIENDMRRGKRTYKLQLKHSKCDARRYTRLENYSPEGSLPKGRRQNSSNNLGKWTTSISIRRKTEAWGWRPLRVATQRSRVCQPSAVKYVDLWMKILV
jgi:hypothetical protein